MDRIYIIEGIRSYSLFSSSVFGVLLVLVLGTYAWKKFRGFRTTAHSIEELAKTLDQVGKKLAYLIFVILAIRFLLFKLAENSDVEIFFSTLTILVIVLTTCSALIALTEIYEVELKRRLGDWFFRSKWVHWFADIEKSFPLIVLIAFIASIINIANEHRWVNQNPNSHLWVFKYCEPSIYMAIHHFTLAINFSLLIFYFLAHRFGNFVIKVSRGNTTKALQKVSAQLIIVAAGLGILAYKLPPADVEWYSLRAKEATISLCSEVKRSRMAISPVRDKSRTASSSGSGT